MLERYPWRGRLDDTWWRISNKKYGPTLHFGMSGDCRFDAPDASFGVCYLACVVAQVVIQAIAYVSDSRYLPIG